jgi:hypothetical protein
MTRTVLSSLAVAAMLTLLADGSANAQPFGQKQKPQPTTGAYSKTLTFTLSTTQPNKPGKRFRRAR